MPILSFMMLLICLAAMLMTNSRAGVVLSFMALALAFLGFFYRDLRRRRWVGAALVIGGLTAFLFLEILGGNIIDRFEMEGFIDQGRLETYRSTLRMIADHPWFGTGLGTFVWSLPAYRSANVSMWGIWTFAHSTPLELAADLGLPLAGLIGLAWLGCLGCADGGACAPAEVIGSCQPGRLPSPFLVWRTRSSTFRCKSLATQLLYSLWLARAWRSHSQVITTISARVRRLPDRETERPLTRIVKAEQ